VGLGPVELLGQVYWKEKRAELYELEMTVHRKILGGSTKGWLPWEALLCEKAPREMQGEVCRRLCERLEEEQFHYHRYLDRGSVVVAPPVESCLSPKEVQSTSKFCRRPIHSPR
jgi:hypothetical protein